MSGINWYFYLVIHMNIITSVDNNVYLLSLHLSIYLSDCYSFIIFII